jgi:hypothetical protein
MSLNGDDVEPGHPPRLNIAPSTAHRMSDLSSAFEHRVLSARLRNQTDRTCQGPLSLRALPAGVLGMRKSGRLVVVLDRKGLWTKIAANPITRIASCAKSDSRGLALYKIKRGQVRLPRKFDVRPRQSRRPGAERRRLAAGKNRFVASLRSPLSSACKAAMP